MPRLKKKPQRAESETPGAADALVCASTRHGKRINNASATHRAAMNGLIGRGGEMLSCMAISIATGPIIQEIGPAFKTYPARFARASDQIGCRAESTWRGPTCICA